MAFTVFDLERQQSIWENQVDINLTESGVHPASLAELAEMGLDLAELHNAALVYIQTNGTRELRETIAEYDRDWSFGSAIVNLVFYWVSVCCIATAIVGILPLVH